MEPVGDDDATDLGQSQRTHAARIDTIEAVAQAPGTTASNLLTVETSGNPTGDRVDLLVERARGLGDEAIDALERVVEAMVSLRGRGGT